MMTPTCDPDVVIEQQSPGVITYRNTVTGRRWEVHGTCTWTDPNSWGPCGEGANDPVPGPPEGRLYIPVTPEFVCPPCPFTFVELDPV